MTAPQTPVTRFSAKMTKAVRDNLPADKARHAHSQRGQQPPTPNPTAIANKQPQKTPKTKAYLIPHDVAENYLQAVTQAEQNTIAQAQEKIARIKVKTDEQIQNAKADAHQTIAKVRADTQRQIANVKART